METTTLPRAASGPEPAPASAASITTIAEDRLEGAEAIRDFIDPKLTLREMRSRLEKRHYPCWKEGRYFVASKTSLLAHWREKAAKAGQPQPSPKGRAGGKHGNAPRPS